MSNLMSVIMVCLIAAIPSSSHQLDAKNKNYWI